MIRQQIKNLLKQTVGQEVEIGYPSNPEHGDYSTNAAMKMDIEPKHLLAMIQFRMEINPKYRQMFEKVEEKDGFINFFLSKEYLQEQVGEILRQGKDFGKPY